MWALGEYMRNHVTFKCTKFNLTVQHENFINENNFGEDLANWLFSELAKLNAVKVGELGQEDWGWYLPLEYSELSFYLNLGEYPSDETDWLLWVESPRVGLFKKLKKVNYIQETNLVSNIVNKILLTEKSISESRWHLEKNFKVGNESEYEQSPTPA